jgi:hypothetical protein
VTDNADSRIARSLLMHLSLLKRQGVTVWDHDCIPLGADVDSAYAEAIRSCKVLVLGMSASLLASPLGEGLDGIVAQGHRFGFDVMPVLFGPVDLRGTPFERFVIFPRHGNDGRVISSSNLDADMAEIAREIRAALTKKLEPMPAPRTTKMRTLAQHEIHEIHDAAITAGLAASRAALLNGIDALFVASLPRSSTDASQILTDITEMNLTLRDGSSPLATWLQNAVRTAGNRAETAVFERYLAPAGPQLPTRLEGAVTKAFCDALKDAFRSRTDLKMMLHARLDWRLDDIVPEAPMGEVVYAVVTYAEAQTQLSELLAAAIADAPRNPQLKAFASAYARPAASGGNRR